MQFQRYSGNPILSPNPQNPWESYASFNGMIVDTGKQYYLLYRAMGEETIVDNKKLRLSVIGKAQSDDGYIFTQRTKLIFPEKEWEKYGCEDPRITKIDGQYLIFYTALSDYPPSYKGIKVAVALSRDLENISQKHLITPFNAKAMAMFPEKINDLYTVFLTVNTDKPPTYIAMAQFKKLETLWNLDFWSDWYRNLQKYIVPLRRLNNDNIEVGATPIKTAQGWILIHSYIKHYFNDQVKKEFRAEAVLLDLHHPQKIIGRIEKPLLIPKEPYECQGIVPEIVFPEGAVIAGDKIRIYYGGADTNCCVAETNLDEFMSSFEINFPYTIKCHKFSYNPLLQATAEHKWESVAVFNPASVELDGKIYLIYRTTSEDNLSYLGLAISNDGFLIDERLSSPIYPFRSPAEKPRHSGKAAGCEDPRITKIGKTLYMLYTAHDGELPRLALTSISIDHFLNRQWDEWTYPKIISPPGVADKDGMLFPEKINNQYVIFHRIEPNICVDFVDDLEFSDGYTLRTTSAIVPHSHAWDAVKIGVNTPPIKTKKGWVVFYHGISRIDRHYRVGALLLDLKNVTNVIGWTPYPILEPEYRYEKEGIVDNVVFPCGYVIKDDTVILYYGGADKVICGATISLNKLLDYLLRSASKKYLV